jgi:hypothetical protein
MPTTKITTRSLGVNVARDNLGMSSTMASFLSGATSTDLRLAMGVSHTTGTGFLVFNTSPTITTPFIAQVNGSAAANGSLTLQGTTNATRTTSYVLIQPNGGNVGIGVSSPTVALDVNGTIRPTCLFLANNATSSSGGIDNNNNNSAGMWFNNFSTFIAGYNGIFFRSSLTGTNAQLERMRITSDGNVGIGTTTANERLTVSGNISASGTIIASNYNPAANVATFLATPTSANLAAAVSDETGTGSLVFKSEFANQSGLLFFRSIITSPVTTTFNVTITPFGTVNLEANKTYRFEMYLPVTAANSGRTSPIIGGNAPLSYKSYQSTHNISAEASNTTQPTVPSSFALQGATSTVVSKVTGILRTTGTGTFIFYFNCDQGNPNGTATLRAGAYLEFYEIN